MVIRAIDGLNEVVGRIVAVVAIIFAAIIIFDVVMRYAFSEPTRWAFDVSKQLFGFYFVLLGGYALRHGAHVKVDILTEKFGPRFTTPDLLRELAEKNQTFYARFGTSEDQAA